MRQSGGSLTVAPGPDPHTATVTLRTTFEPIDPTGTDQLTAMIHEAFPQSVESLRRFVEDRLPGMPAERTALPRAIASWWYLYRVADRYYARRFGVVVGRAGQHRG